MPTVGPYKVSIRVNGEDLYELNPPPDENLNDFVFSAKKRVVYIAAAEGLNFEVNFKMRENTKWATGYLGVALYLDDICARYQLIERKHFPRNKQISMTWIDSKFLEGQIWVKRRFLFRALVTSDTHCSTADLQRIARHTGTIRLVLWNMTEPTGGPTTKIATKNQTRVIPEKALKGQPIDLATSFGNPSPAQPSHGCNSRIIGDALLQCTFKYRSRKALQMLDLIPATPEPIPLHERDPDTLTLVEARQLLGRIKDRQMDVKAEKVGVKQEKKPEGGQGQKREASLISIGDDSDGDDDDVIFVEAKRIRRAASEDVDVVDLS